MRNEIEGAFGVGKRRYGLGLVLAKLRETSESWIAMVIFVMNIARWMRDIFVFISNTAQNTMFSFAINHFRKINQSLKLSLCLLASSF